jgi:glycosyltransferase involved in cell wall biosynthesis
MHYLSNKYKHTGANIIASKIINYFKNKELFILDSLETSLNSNKNLKCDLLIGLSSKNFIKYSLKNFNSYKILVCVNSNPYFRNSKIIDEKLRLSKNLDFYFSKLKTELVNPFVTLICVMLSDKVIITGYNFVLKTFIAQGISKKKVFKICHHLKSSSNVITKNYFSKNKTYLYFNSQTSIRKNIIFFLESWIKISKYLSDSKLIIIGVPVTSDIKNNMNRLLRKVNNIKFIDTFLNHERLYEYYLKSDFYINISLEEGQVFTALEAIKYNCIPICSINCGLNLNESNIIKDPSNFLELKNKILNLYYRHEYFSKKNFIIKNRIQADAEKYSIRKTLDKFYEQN